MQTTCRPRLEKRLREIDRGAGGVRGVPDPPLGIWDGQTLLQDLDDLLESTSLTSAAREILSSRQPRGVSRSDVAQYFKEKHFLFRLHMSLDCVSVCRSEVAVLLIEAGQAHPRKVSFTR